MWSSSPISVRSHGRLDSAMRLHARDVARKLLDEEVELADEGREHDHDDARHSDEQQEDERQGGERAIDPDPLQRSTTGASR